MMITDNDYDSLGDVSRKAADRGKIITLINGTVTGIFTPLTSWTAEGYL